MTNGYQPDDREVTYGASVKALQRTFDPTWMNEPFAGQGSRVEPSPAVKRGRLGAESVCDLDPTQADSKFVRLAA